MIESLFRATIVALIISKVVMSRLIYSLILYLLSPLLFLRLYIKAQKNYGYKKRWLERLGFSPMSPSRIKANTRVWFHTVSVGETIAAAPLIEACIANPLIDDVLVTTMTPTGSDRVRALFGERVHHVYCPWDLPLAVSRFLKVWRPKIAVMMETELWPNIAHHCRKQGISIFLANGRMSEKSLLGYLKLKRLVLPMLMCFDRLLVQNTHDRERFIRLGANPEKVVVAGSIKFDISIDETLKEKAQALRVSFSHRPCWVAASTHLAEDEIMLEAHQRLLEVVPNALLILVPRHPERFESVTSLSLDKFEVQQRSSSQVIAEKTRVLVGDTMGEMMIFFGASDAAVVCGSFVSHGGHNVLEPASWAKPVISGPYVHNFQVICDEMKNDHALSIVNSSASLGDMLIKVLSDPAFAVKKGNAAHEFLLRHQGALDKQLKEITAHL